MPAGGLPPLHGCADLSGFEPIDRVPQRQPLQTQVGATHTLMRPHGTDWWITVVGDVPPQTLKRFHQALERRH